MAVAPRLPPPLPTVGKTFLTLRIRGSFIPEFLKQVLASGPNPGHHSLSTSYRPSVMLSSCQVGFFRVSRIDLNHSHLHTFASAILCIWNVIPASSPTCLLWHASHLGYGNYSLSLNSYSSINTQLWGLRLWDPSWTLLS